MLMQSRDADMERAGSWLYIDEIAHRTMNDYAFMLATVECASRAVTDPNSAQALNSISARLRAGVKAYRALTPPRREGVRRLDEDLEDLCAALSISAAADRAIGITLFCDPVELGARRSWQVGLIVSELVTNAVKHAFPERDGNEVTINVREVCGQLVIAVADNGSASEVVSIGRGWRIIGDLVTTLGGVVRRKHALDGSMIIVALPAIEEDGVSFDHL